MGQRTPILQPLIKNHFHRLKKAKMQRKYKAQSVKELQFFLKKS